VPKDLATKAAPTVPKKVKNDASAATVFFAQFEAKGRDLSRGFWKKINWNWLVQRQGEIQQSTRDSSSQQPRTRLKNQRD
jgi:hypothetical protein